MDALEPNTTNSTTAARILVVNDTQEILEMFQLLLEPEGYEVFLYSFAPHDLTEVQRIQPDLVILDLIFGTEKLGWQLLDKMHMTRETSLIPVVVCTAAINEVRQNEGYLRAMGISVVLKPFDIDLLLQVVKDALAKPPKPAPAPDTPPDQSA
jgi:DNA-binding response OmpR family regulator